MTNQNQTELQEQNLVNQKQELKESIRQIFKQLLIYLGIFVGVVFGFSVIAYKRQSKNVQKWEFKNVQFYSLNISFKR